VNEMSEEVPRDDSRGATGHEQQVTRRVADSRRALTAGNAVFELALGDRLGQRGVTARRR
jgi:hypothetical protein